MSNTSISEINSRLDRILGDGEYHIHSYFGSSENTKTIIKLSLYSQLSACQLDSLQLYRLGVNQFTILKIKPEVNENGLTYLYMELSID